VRSTLYAGDYHCASQHDAEFYRQRFQYKAQTVTLLSNATDDVWCGYAGNRVINVDTHDSRLNLSDHSVITLDINMSTMH